MYFVFNCNKSAAYIDDFVNSLSKLYYTITSIRYENKQAYKVNGGITCDTNCVQPNELETNNQANADI